MNEKLTSLSKLFTEILLRIPDFQRGYAWTNKEVEEFWNDLIRLKPEHNHYVGVLTLEKVQPEKFDGWLDDLWIINSKKYQPYYIVDGQQRITTSMILLTAILQTMTDKGVKNLNYTSRNKIIEKFLYEGKDETSNRTYLFCYEKDNPSYSFLINKIFNADDIVGEEENTIYTNNLLNAKNYFLKKLSELELDQLQEVYSKITQHFLFNIYEISEDIDVYVSFETMNNRGKRLSLLELLKNRLIYISSIFNIDGSEQLRMREKINTCWKTVYHYLGVNKENPLNDDEFLTTHYYLFFYKEMYEYFKKRNDSRLSYKYYEYNSSANLLKNYFIPERVENSQLTTKNIYDYLNDFNSSIIIWSNINNPELSSFPADIVENLKRINYLISTEGPYYYESEYYKLSHTKILCCAVLKELKKHIEVRKFLKCIERFLFIKQFYPYEVFYKEKEEVSFEELTYKYLSKEITIDEIIYKLNTCLQNVISKSYSTMKLNEFYNKGGFYNKRVTPYILWEYEKDLQKQSKNVEKKIPEFHRIKDIYDSIEHIYPKSASSTYWTSRFNLGKQNSKYRNSIGNLVMVAQPKNEKLANKPFPEKCSNTDNNTGYRYGSYSEMEVAQNSEWTPKTIYDRGVKIIQFINRRWDLHIKKCDYKIFLGLEKKKEEA